MKKGTLILIVGLPGSGKSTLISYLRDNYPYIIFPVSWTTRAKRPEEVEGLVYHFATDTEFQEAIDSGFFLEWVSIDGGHRYGTLKEEVLPPLLAGKLLLREVEVQGARRMHELLPDMHVVSIFITSESGWADLEKRIRDRAPISAAELQERKERYERELLFRSEADYVIENKFGHLEESKQQIKTIIGAIQQKG